ncbi:SDR family oxidoreductase [Lichenihabitans sp. Uapishka_5]|uniref:SDR family oxidoreductase n=1 Tax=Lichenihabitans sp. Uapishka_5 TaxID=3037302 RepID=UPI0029E80376|nr:SDR family oxidoreductase [Lichenihabitans sp. Uapishka_5]MDX7951125.1 SDR family oxidoreductase [Lichenihabitans sp. Uapishka_5]
MDLGLVNKRALVVGASQGLGKAIALALLAEGTTVWLAARSRSKIEAWCAALPADMAARVTIHDLDLADGASVDRLADAVLAGGGADILVNNCGGPAPGGVLDTAAETWTKAFTSMAASVFHLTDRLVRPMTERGWGRVITIGSSGIEQPIPSLAVSNAIRGSVAGWSKSLAAEVAGQGVTVNMVLPGRVATERVDSLDQNRASRGSLAIEEVRRQHRAEIPAGRYGTPEEFAAVVTFLAGVPAGYVTGSMIRVDGGLIRSL